MDVKNNEQQQNNHKVIFARHGITEFNMLPKAQKIKDNIKLNQIYLDCCVSEKGKLQLKDLSLKLNELNITTCFSSPLNRCLESVTLALENHPNKKNITVFIEPNLTEFISGSQHNVSTDIIEKKKKYNNQNENELKFDWKYFDLFVENTEFKDFPSCYFLEFIDNRVDNFDEVKDTLKREFSLDNLSHFLENHAHKSDKKPESYTNLLKRCKKFKQNLKEHMSNLSGNQIVFVMTHSAIIKLSSSKIVENLDAIDGYPEDAFFPKHTETIEINI